MKFSELFVLDKKENPFSDTFGATSLAVLTDFMSTKELANASIEDLIAFLVEKSKNRFSNHESTAKLLQKAVRDSYRLDKAIKRINNHQFQCLLSISGIGPVFAAGIISELGDATKFNNQTCVAKYASLTWRKKQSGNFTVDNTFLTKTGNKYLRYYLLEATASIIRNNDEALVHKHKRALALTGRKLVRLIFALLRNTQLYTSKEIVEKATI